MMKADLVHLSLKKPPEFLFGGVSVRIFDRTVRQGLKRNTEPFVMLYEDAKEIPRGRVRKMSFVVLTGVMAEDGYRFAHADTGEWVTDEVPSKYIRLK